MACLCYGTLTYSSLIAHLQQSGDHQRLSSPQNSFLAARTIALAPLACCSYTLNAWDLVDQNIQVQTKQVIFTSLAGKIWSFPRKQAVLPPGCNGRAEG